MRILNGGHAIWMGGWTTQVYYHQDVIAADSLVRSPEVLAVLLQSSMETSPGTWLLSPAYALADSLIHQDHHVVPPDEIDPDYLDQDERENLRLALRKLGCKEADIESLARPYDEFLKATVNEKNQQESQHSWTGKFKADSFSINGNIASAILQTSDGEKTVKGYKGYKNNIKALRNAVKDGDKVMVYGMLMGCENDNFLAMEDDRNPFIRLCTDLEQDDRNSFVEP